MVVFLPGFFPSFLALEIELVARPMGGTAEFLEFSGKPTVDSKSTTLSALLPN